MEKKKENILKMLYLRKDQIMADVNSQIEMVGETHLLSTGAKNPVFSNVTNHYEHQFDRWLKKYVGKVKQRMAAYVLAPEQHGVMNSNKKWEEETIPLSFPWYWNETTFAQLIDAIHEYIVNSVLVEFFLLTISSKDPVTADKQSMADDAYSDIKHYCVTSLPGTQKKTLHPF